MSKDVAALRAAMAGRPMPEGHDGFYLPNTEEVLDNLHAAGWLLIDPTAPEAVAALAAALRTDHRNPATPGHGDCTWSADHEAYAAAILPAFIARLRGET